MKLPLKSREELLKKARPVVNNLSGLSTYNALRVLSVTSELILEQCTKNDEPELIKQVKNITPNLLPNPSWVSKIDKDPEIKESGYAQNSSRTI